MELSEEEKKAIEYLKYMGKNIDFNKIGYVYGNETIEQILNLRERQAEEIKKWQAKWDKDTHQLQNALDLANAEKIELQKKNKSLNVRLAVELLTYNRGESNETIKKYNELTEKTYKLQAITGLTLNDLIDLFLRGYTLQQKAYKTNLKNELESEQ